MTARERFDVAVVGAGPAGASVALRLARDGASVALLDARSFPRSKPCGDCLSPGATPLLEELDVREEVEATGAGALSGWRIRTPGGRWFGGAFGAGGDSPDGPQGEGRKAGPAGGREAAGDRDRTRGAAVPGAPARGLALPRHDLDTVLARAAAEAGARLREGTRTFDLLREDGRVRGVRARGPCGDVLRVRSEVVVGADGLRSTVARRLSGVRRGPRPRLALVGRLAGVQPPTGEAADGPGRMGEMRLGSDGCLGLAPVGRGRWNATLVVPQRRAAEISRDRRRFFREGLARYGVHRRFRAAERLRPLEITGPFRIAPDRTTAPGALLVGDAAGYFDPLTGQGVHRALATGRAAAEAVATMIGDRGSARRAAARRRYRLELRRLLAPGRALQKVVDAVCRGPLIELTGRLMRDRPGLARLFVDVTGDRAAPTALVDPRRLLAAWRRGATGPADPSARDRPPADHDRAASGRGPPTARRRSFADTTN